MKILVTGGAGFIGSHVVDAYCKAGHDVIVVDNFETGIKGNIHPKARLYSCNVMSNELKMIFQKERPDVVNHHAAQVNVRRSVEDPVYDAKTNVIGIVNVLACSLDAKVQRFIFISSGGAIYGNASVPTLESYTPKPLSPYGLSKYTGEKYVEMCNSLYGLPFIILRYANVYGPRQNPKGEAGVIAIFINNMQKNQEPVIFGDGEQTRDYIHVMDVVEANLLALTRGENTCFNIGTGKQTSVNTIFSLLQTEMNFTKKAQYGEKIVGEVQHGALDINRAKKLLGWEPKIVLKQGLHMTVEKEGK